MSERAVDPSERHPLAPFMRRALALAERGGGATAPNPMVGCVVLDRDGAVVGEGWHAGAGGPHAEVVALDAARAAGRDPTGGTAVVTLEPCAAHGRTPPCVDRLVAEGIARVAFALEDPATGKGGAGRLRDAGLEVEGGLLARAARPLLEAWLHWVETGRPLVHVKTAQTLSGHATRGEAGPRWVTGPAARAHVHRLRRRLGAVLIGSGTALADDPLLTVRDWPPEGGPPEDPARDDHPWPDVQPLRAVVDGRLRTPPEGRLVRSAEATPVVVFARPDADAGRAGALEAAGVEVVRVPGAARGVDLTTVLAELAAREVTGILAEPGPTLAAGLLEAGLADRWTAFVAPGWTPAPDAVPLLPGGGEETWLADPEWSVHGDDAAVSGRPRRGARGTLPPG